MEEDIVKAAAEILKIDKGEIDVEESMNEYGFDSIGFTRLANKLNRTYKLELTPTIFFEHLTVNAVKDDLISNHKDLFRAYYNFNEKQVSNDAATPLPLKKEDALSEYKKHTVPFSKKPLNRFSKKSISANEPIAIIGMSGMMPGSKDLDVFWQNLVEGKDLISEVPTDRWDWSTYSDIKDSKGKSINCKWGGFMPDVDKFDAGFFGISPREAELMDPQQRLVIQTIWKTIEDAGYNPRQLAGSQTGLFMGVSTRDYLGLLFEHNVKEDAYSSTGTSSSVLANRISYLLDIHGPSEPIDTACSSSLVAIHRAVHAIRANICDKALVGGVNTLLSPSAFISFSLAGMLSRDGRCKTFDKSANGYVRGEGVGAFFLKPLSQAERDGDFIYALIRGVAENHGGQSSSLTAPNLKAQADVIVKAYEDAQMDPSTVSYIEAHGTGTSLGDPIEVDALKKLLIKCTNSGVGVRPLQLIVI